MCCFIARVLFFLAVAIMIDHRKQQTHKTEMAVDITFQLFITIAQNPSVSCFHVLDINSGSRSRYREVPTYTGPFVQDVSTPTFFPGGSMSRKTPAICTRAKKKHPHGEQKSTCFSSGLKTLFAHIELQIFKFQVMLQEIVFLTSKNISSISLKYVKYVLF